MRGLGEGVAEHRAISAAAAQARLARLEHPKASVRRLTAHDVAAAAAAEPRIRGLVADALARRAAREADDHTAAVLLDLLDRVLPGAAAELVGRRMGTGAGHTWPGPESRRAALLARDRAAVAWARSRGVGGVHSSPMPDPSRHLLALEGVPVEHIRSLLRSAVACVDPGNEHPLAGRVVATAFFEDSTRTRSSFTAAAVSLGATVIDCSGQGTSIAKGETLADTARTLHAIGAEALVVRTKQAGGPALIASEVDCCVINAGDGRHEHPTQGLLDALKILEHLGRLREMDLSGVRVAVVGELVNSRVLRSDVAALTALGAEVVAVGPPTLAPRSLAAIGCTVSHDLDAVLPGVDAVQMLRVQFERHGASATGGTGALASIRDYRAGFALTVERARRMKPGACLMHPGPMNRGIEVDDAVARGGAGLPVVLVERQVSLGVAVRRAVLRGLLAPAPAFEGAAA